MAADSPTRGRCEHGHTRAEGCRPCFWVGGPPAPSPVDTTEPPAETREWKITTSAAAPVGRDGEPLRRRPIPAETQQDDERELAVADRLWRLYTHLNPTWMMPDTVEGFRKDARYVLDGLAARTQPDGEVRQHRMDADCWCSPRRVGTLGVWTHNMGDEQ